jgi:hypothetical protein
MASYDVPSTIHESMASGAAAAEAEATLWKNCFHVWWGCAG